MLKKLPKEYRLTLVGYGDLEDELREHAKKFGNRVQFVIGPISKKLVDLYQHAHLFLFPSQSDTQGLVLAESMACSTPVIALDGVGQRDVIKDGENGFIVHSPDEMRDRIERVASDEALYNKLQRGAWQTAQSYDPKRLVNQIIALYER